MQVNEAFLELFDRIPPLLRSAVDGLTPAELVQAPGEGANPVGWLTWHLTRVEDAHVAEILEGEQLWVSGPWAARFGLEPDPSNSGYGHRPEEVASVRPDGPDVLVEYHEAVHARTRTMLQGLTADEVDRIVDESWDPPVTLGVRLVSIADDCLQHVGQAAYVRGLLGR